MITLLLLIIPVVSALILLIGAKNNSSKAANIAEVLTVVELLLYVCGQSAYNINSLDQKLTAKFDWVKSMSIQFHLGWDGLTALMIGLTSFVVALIIYSLRNLKYTNKNRLYALVFLTQAALIGVFAAKDIFVFYFFFEAALIPVYMIANFWGGENSSKITIKMLIYTVFGSLFMLVAFVILYMRAQSSDIEIIKSTVGLLPVNAKNFVFWAFMLAFAIKMPIFPMHTWLPDAYSESPTPATMLLSGLLSKMGVYGLIRILLPFAPFGVQNYGFIIVVLSVIGLIYGSIIAIKQDSIKRLIAYSSFSHMGIMAGAIMTNSVQGVQGAIFQMVAHGINAVGLFYVAKLIADRTNTRSLSGMGGLAHTAPKLSVAFMVILLGSVALPLTNGFVGEFLMLKSIFDFDPILGFVAGFSVIFGAVYMLRYFQKSMFGDCKFPNVKDLSLAELSILVPIMLAIIITGVFPNMVLHISEPFVQTLNLISK